MDRVYAAIDLKSFYASVECREKGLDPLTTNLVVADETRTEKTVCLAVTPSLKAYGISGRARLYEVIQKVKEVNMKRRIDAPNHTFLGKSCNSIELAKKPELKLDYIIAPPRMKFYMKYSAEIYSIYLKYISPEDIFAYSIDEVFCDITKYLNLYHLTAKELVTKMIMDVYKQTGITATAGIGTNLFLSKVAMDIGAKHIEADKYGVRIAVLDEMTFRKKLWSHKPITDFWRVGRGYAKRLAMHNMFTMGDVARCSVYNEELLYKLFGVNAELLIDHSWGWESATIKSIKSCKPKSKSINSGQVLHCPYNYEKAKLIVKEMVELIVLDMVEKEYITDQLVLDIEYDVENLSNSEYLKFCNMEITKDKYGRDVPKPAHGTIRLKTKTSSTKIIMDGFLKLYDMVVNSNLLIRKINICVGNLAHESEENTEVQYEQMNLFTNYKENEKENKNLQKEKNLQKAIIDIKHKFGKNAILKGMNLEEGATTVSRNCQIGGHTG